MGVKRLGKTFHELVPHADARTVCEREDGFRLGGLQEEPRDRTVPSGNLDLNGF